MLLHKNNIVLKIAIPALDTIFHQLKLFLSDYVSVSHSLIHLIAIGTLIYSIVFSMKKVILISLLLFVGMNVFAQTKTEKIAPQFEYTPNKEYLTVPRKDKKIPKVEALKKSSSYKPTTKNATTPADAKLQKTAKAPQFEYTAPTKIVPRTIAEPPQSIVNWKKVSHDFGIIDYQKPVTSEFEFVNTGDVPITIKDAKGSCGCTATNFTKDVILPGKTARITATYNAEDIGPFKKTVTVYTSADTNKEGTVLHITGEVIWKL